jgi:hypothetical protein
MRDITPQELKNQLLDSVKRLVAPIGTQREWVERQGYPVEELILDLDASWPVWKSRLLEEHMIDNADVDALDDLTRYALSLIGPQNEPLFTWEAIDSTPEWSQIRELAAKALASLRRNNPSGGDASA